jgi:Rrf2 family protein
MIALGKNFNQGPVSLRKIAKEKRLPFKFLEQVALDLRGAGLIEAKEGKGGGYFLTKPPKRISVAEVVETLEGPVEVGLCFGCPKVKVCGQKNVWSEVGDKVRETIEGKTLGDLL